MQNYVAPPVRRLGLGHLPPAGRPARVLFAFIVALLLIAEHTSAASATASPGSTGAAVTAAPPVSLNIRDNRQYVFTMGVLADVHRDAVTLRFEDGQTERYAVDATTTIYTENGEAQSVAD